MCASFNSAKVRTQSFVKDLLDTMPELKLPKADEPPEEDLEEDDDDDL